MAAGMPWYEVLPLAYLGNLLPIPFALFFGEKVLDWVGTLRPFTGFVTRYKAKLESKKDQVTKYARIGLFLFVAVPLPGTGAWSGAALAALLGLRMKNALLAITGGVLIAGVIMTAGAYGLLGFLRLF